jgi:hypothetical protein
MLKYTWLAVAAMMLTSYGYTRVVARAEACEFRLATAQHVAPQVRQNARKFAATGCTVAAKAEWAWFAQAHTGLGQAVDRLTLID